MGYIKQKMLDDAYEQELKAFLERLIETDAIEGTALGISKQLLDKGKDSLSDKQEYVIEQVIEKYREFKSEICDNGNVGKLTDYLEIEENGLCPMCEADKEKFMSED